MENLFGDLKNIFSANRNEVLSPERRELVDTWTKVQEFGRDHQELLGEARVLVRNAAKENRIRLGQDQEETAMDAITLFYFGVYRVAEELGIDESQIPRLKVIHRDEKQSITSVFGYKKFKADGVSLSEEPTFAVYLDNLLDSSKWRQLGYQFPDVGGKRVARRLPNWAVFRRILDGAEEMYHHDYYQGKNPEEILRQERDEKYIVTRFSNYMQEAIYLKGRVGRHRSRGEDYLAKGVEKDVERLEQNAAEVYHASGLEYDGLLRKTEFAKRLFPSVSVGLVQFENHITSRVLPEILHAMRSVASHDEYVDD